MGTECNDDSPRCKIKFLCSHGGKILPRPTDGHLKYVGGETRVVAIPRDTTFSELMKKVNTLFEGEVVLKYQIIPEDLDALVTIRTDEDFKHMIEEHDRHENEGIPKLRAFLFPVNGVTGAAPKNNISGGAVEQRYIDAINGVVQTSLKINSSRPSFSISSACSSPNSSPEAIDSVPLSRPLTVHRVSSSPSLCSLASYQNNVSNHHQYHHYYQNYPSPYSRLPLPLEPFARSPSPGVHGQFNYMTSRPSSSSRYEGCSSVPHSPRKRALRL